MLDGDHMVVSKSIVVVGDGASGIFTANKLRTLNEQKNARITLIGNNLKNFCRSDGPQISLRMKKFDSSVKPTSFLLNDGIDFIHDEVTQVRPNNRLVYARGGRKFDYDYLVLAPGLKDSAELIPGYEGEAMHMLDLQHSLELGKSLEDLREGTVVIGTADAPVPNLMGFYELALLYNEQLKLMHLDSKIHIKFVTPWDGAFPVPKLSEFFESKFEQAGIELETKFKVASVNQKNKEITSSEGSNLNYDLLVLPPPLQTRDFLLTDELLGNTPKDNVDKNTLRIQDYDDVYLSGDALDFLLSDIAGSFVTQGRFVSHRISSDATGIFNSDAYNGSVTLSAMTSLNRGITLSYSYNSEVMTPAESYADYRFKRHYSDFYFSSLLRGLI